MRPAIVTLRAISGAPKALLIPAAAARHLGLEKGDSVAMKVSDSGTLHITAPGPRRLWKFGPKFWLRLPEDIGAVGDKYLVTWEEKEQAVVCIPWSTLVSHK